MDENNSLILNQTRHKKKPLFITMNNISQDRIILFKWLKFDVLKKDMSK